MLRTVPQVCSKNKHELRKPAGRSAYLSLEFAKNPAADFTNSRGFIKKSVKIREIRGKKDRHKAVQKSTLNSSA